MPHASRRLPLLLSVLGLVAIAQGVALVLTCRWAPDAFSDEEHFLPTIRLFAEGLTLHTLRTYEEMSTPLPFWLYAQFGSLFGMEVWRLRLLSAVVAVFTAGVYAAYLARLTPHTFITILGVAVVALNPYTLALGSLVFTDAFAMMFLVLALLALACERVWVAGVMVAGAILCRQYLAFFSVAMGFYAVLVACAGPRREAYRWGGAAILSVLPMAALAILWGGPHPVNELSKHYMSDARGYQPVSLVLYVACAALYTLPVWAKASAALPRDRVAAVAGVVAVGVYAVFPVETSPASIRAGIPTVGLIDRVVTSSPGPWLRQAVFGAGFVLGVILLVGVVRRLLAETRARQTPHASFLAIALVTFLLTMPFSYLHWEKYVLPALPLLTAWLTLQREPRPPGHAVGDARVGGEDAPAARAD